MICPRPECPIEQTRRALNQMRVERNMGPGAQMDTVMSCKLCGQTKGWRRDADGTERALRHEEVWGAPTGKRSA